MQRLVILVVGICLAGGSNGAIAQTSADGSIRGVVRDEQGAVLPGVTITATSLDAPGTHTATSGAEGEYRLLNVPPGQFLVEAELQGFAKYVRDNIVMRAGVNLPLDITMRVGSVSEILEVKGDTPMLESTSAVQAVNISGEFQRALPLSTKRSWIESLDLTPGVVSTEATSSTVQGYSIHGADVGSHVLQIDGADMAAASQNQPIFINLNTDAIQDVQVKTAAVDASAPLGLGTVVNVASRTGTNVFRGSANVRYQGKRWNDSNVPGGTSSLFGLVQPDLALGGPLQRDRWWFFGAYRYAHSETGISRSAAQLATLQLLSPGFEPFDNVTEGSYYFVKATGQLSGKHQISSFYQYDIDSSSAGGLFETLATRLKRGGTGFAANLASAWSNSTTSRFSASYNDKAGPIIAQNPNQPRQQVFAGVQATGGRLTGVGSLANLGASRTSSNDPNQYKVTLAADVTHFRTGRTGTHDLRAGVYVQPRVHLETTIRYVNNGFALEELMLSEAQRTTATPLPFHRQVFDVSEWTQTKADQSDIALYVQDFWQPTSRLTLSAGVRLDRIKRVDRLFDTTTQRSTDVGPRFGVNYSPTTSREDIIRASWGRVHEVISQNSLSVGSLTPGVRDSYDLDLNGTFETVLVTPPVNMLNPTRVLDVDRWHQPFADEWSLGYRRQLGGQLSLEMTAVRRAYRDRPALVETNGIYDGRLFQGYRDESVNEIYQVTNNQWNEQIVSDLGFVAVKDTAWLRLIGSYTRQWRHMDGTWQPNDPASFIQPDTFDNDRGIGSTRSSTATPADANSLSGTAQAQYVGPVAQWRDHVVRIGASVQAPWALSVATTYVYQSGIWSGPVVTSLNAPDPAFGPSTVRLSNGRSVSNPLATPIRFVGSARSDGQLTTAAYHMWNIRLGRQFRWGDRRADVSFDVFNVTNNGAFQSFISGANQTYSASYGQGSGVQGPRAGAVTFAFTF